MLFENFILRYLKLNENLVFFSAITENKISLRYSHEARAVLHDLSDLLNCLIEETNGKYEVSVNFANGTVSLNYREAGVLS